MHTGKAFTDSEEKRWVLRADSVLVHTLYFLSSCIHKYGCSACFVPADGSTDFKAEASRYHLYVALACPWAHRALIVRRLKGLEDVITVTVVDWEFGEFGWSFTDSVRLKFVWLTFQCHCQSMLCVLLPLLFFWFRFNMSLLNIMIGYSDQILQQ